MDVKQLADRVCALEGALNAILNLPVIKAQLRSIEGQPYKKDDFHRICSEHHGADAKYVLSRLHSTRSSAITSVEQHNRVSAAISKMTGEQANELVDAIKDSHDALAQIGRSLYARSQPCVRYVYNGYPQEERMVSVEMYEISQFLRSASRSFQVDTVAVNRAARVSALHERRRKRYLANFVWMTFARRLLDPVTEMETMRLEAILQLTEEERERIRAEERERIRAEERERIRAEERERIRVEERERMVCNSSDF